MNSKLTFSLILGGAMVLTGCGKKLSEIGAEYFTVNPSPLEVVGDKVPATVTGQIPEKFFVKNAEVTITPYLVYGDKETASAPYTIQGEKVRGNNQVISYDNGGTVTVPVMYAYTPEMAKSDLVLAFQVQQGSKSYTLPRVKVAEGVIATSTIATAATVDPAASTDNFQRFINEQYTADIRFLINQTNIRKSELSSDELATLKQKVADAQGNEKLQVEGINIASYASPDGGVKLNTRIAEGREKNTQKFLNETLKKDNIKEFGELTADFTPQDWEGFQQLVANSNIQDKNLILSVLSMYKDPEQREREIRNLSTVFDQLAEEILPQLRRSRLTASIKVIGKSDEELVAAFNSDPKSLTIDELLYTATLTNDNNKRAEIYKACVANYPNDYRGYNNLGMTQYAAGDYAAAQKNFDKARSLAPASNEVQMNQGLCDLMNNNLRSANDKFGAAAGAEGLNEALGVYYLKLGDYNNAVKAFGNSKSNNAALAQIMTNDYSKAKSTLAGISTPDATTYYLLAVLGARTNNEEMVLSNLSQAIKLDSSLAQKASTDMEFAKVNISSVIL
ncbi:MAG: tetratricopeptide repeat protein [Muribaculaceae bacterium]